MFQMHFTSLQEWEEAHISQIICQFKIDSSIYLFLDHLDQDNEGLN